MIKLLMGYAAESMNYFEQSLNFSKKQEPKTELPIHLVNWGMPIAICGMSQNLLNMTNRRLESQNRLATGAAKEFIPETSVMPADIWGRSKKLLNIVRSHWLLTER